MSCCCAPDAEKESPARVKLEFSKVSSSGFEKERKEIYYSDNSEKSPCDKERELSSSTFTTDDESDSEEEVNDMVLVDGNDADMEACDDEDTLMERVWWLLKPPYVPPQAPVVSARRIQVCKERLSSTVKGQPVIRAALKDQVKKNLRSRGASKRQKFAMLGNRQANDHAVCGANEIKVIPACAQRLGDIL